MAEYYIGIDLGGTFIKFALLNGRQQVGEVQQLPTPREEGPEGIVRTMGQGARKVIEAAGASAEEVRGAGVGAPGPLKISEGIVVAMPNIAGLENVPLGDMVSKELSMPAVLENDANAAAYGEFICGAGADAGMMVLLTLGTGIGSGIINNGEILHGAHEMGAEMGHMIIVPEGRRCGCGQNGCLERYCSATFMAENAKRRLREEKPESSLQKVLEEKGDIEALDICRATEAGDDFATEVWDRATYYLALACVNICRIFDPDKIVLAGGMTRAGGTLMNPLVEHFARLNWTMAEVVTEIVTAELGADAGAIGAAGVAQKELSAE